MHIATSLFIAGIFFAENAPPSADRIRVMQEAHAREHARAHRAIPQVWQRLPFPKPEPTLSEEDRSRLERALERFVYERPGELVDLRKVRP
jgi:hypothetical protein